MHNYMHIFISLKLFDRAKNYQALCISQRQNPLPGLEPRFDVEHKKRSLNCAFFVQLLSTPFMVGWVGTA